jgi:CBS domain containing-hemolysin-like protein
MRTLIILSMVFSLSAFAQTRVKENIKQKSVATSEDGGSKKVVVKPAKPAVVKGKR